MPDRGVGHPELVSGDHVVMIGLAGGERFGDVSSITLVFADDDGATSERANAAAGTVVGDPLDRPWGLRQALIADPQGQRGAHGGLVASAAMPSSSATALRRLSRVQSLAPSDSSVAANS